MKTTALFSLLFTVVFAAFSSLHGAEVSAFANFQGDYLKHGTVKISDGDGTAATGETTMQFTIGSTGKRARLKITGAIEFNGATRPFSAICIFKPKNIVALSNLAPALDDSRSAEGTYTLAPRKIIANAPFIFSTTTGTGTLLIRLKKRPLGTQLIVVQTLSTSALTRPITWTFKAVSRR